MDACRRVSCSFVCQMPTADAVACEEALAEYEQQQEQLSGPELEALEEPLGEH